MKTPAFTSSRAAFTLVELLVVIGIIVILMSLLLGAIPGVQNSMRKTEAKNMTNQIAVAVNAYYTEYAKFPPVEDPSAKTKTQAVDEDTVVGDPKLGAKLPNNVLFHTLRNIPKTPNDNYQLNPRKVGFFDGKAAIVSAANKPRGGFFDRSTQGTSPDAEVDGCLYDPWGTQYGVVMDTTGDERIDLENFYLDYTGDDAVSGKAPRKRTGAFSVGKDEMLGNKNNKLYRNGTDTSDDVVSWE